MGHFEGFGSHRRQLIIFLLPVHTVFLVYGSDSTCADRERIQR